jgi:hypothetical protein
MSRNSARASSPHWSTAPERVSAYAQWRVSCGSVWEAYRRWSKAPRGDAHLAHAAYMAALDREDEAARVYSRLTKHRPVGIEGLSGVGGVSPRHASPDALFKEK